MTGLHRPLRAAPCALRDQDSGEQMNHLTSSLFQREFQAITSELVVFSLRAMNS